MRFSKVIISSSAEGINSIGLKRWKKYEVEVELNDGDDVDEAKRMAEDKLSEWHEGRGDSLMPLNVSHQSYHQSIPEEQIQRTTKEEAIQRMITAINECTSIPILETFKMLVQKENNPIITEAYNKKMEELK